MISISFSNIGYNQGVLSKVVLAKLAITIPDFENYENYILKLNLFIFSLFLILLVSKNKSEVFIIIFKTLKIIINGIRKFLLAGFKKKNLNKKIEPIQKKKCFLKRKIKNSKRKFYSSWSKLFRRTCSI